jgi:curli biogenesis system outer membrane secretion channel CsgG
MPYHRLLWLLMAMIFSISSCSNVATLDINDDGSDKFSSQEGVIYSKGPKLRVGVVNFGNDTPRKVNGIEQVATNILTTLLHESGNFIVIPQQDLDSIMEQQKLSLTGIISAESSSKIGGILGLNAIVTGSITSYAEFVEGSTSFFSQTKIQVSKVGVDYRIVDTTTGVQLFSAHGEGEFRKKSDSVMGFGSKSSFDVSLKDGALRDALKRAMIEINNQLPSELWMGRVANREGEIVYINAGQQTGFEIGDFLSVHKVTKDIIDPQTGLSLGQAPGQEIGLLEVTGFFGLDGSIAKILSGEGGKRGDVVRFNGGS